MALVLLTGCPGPGVGNLSTDPRLAGCPTGDVEVDTPVVLTISISEGMVVGVLPIKTVNATAVSTRTDSATFSVTVMPTAVGTVELSFDVDSDVASRVTLNCTFTAVTNLGACCEGNACEETVSDSCPTSRTFFGTGTTCFPVNPCFGACCGLPSTTVGVPCVEAGQEACETEGGQFHGVGTTCAETLGDLAECPCSSDEHCQDDVDPCTDAVCLLGLCGQLNKCSGDGVCDPENGACPIEIDVVFPNTLANGESADLIINWSSVRDTNFKKSATFGSAVGQCPDGYGCPSKVLTLELADPFVITNAFTCRIDGATDSVPFLYEVSLTDAEGLGSKTVRVPFVCKP